MWKVFDLVPGVVYAVAVAVLLACFGWAYVMWAHAEASFAEYRVMVVEATQKADAAARQREQEMQRTNERIAREAAQREKELAGRVAAASTAAASLRDNIYALNARPAPTDTKSAAFAVEARTARELLGACSERYRDVAATADGLAAQVMGLQQFAADVCGAGK